MFYLLESLEHVLWEEGGWREELVQYGYKQDCVGLDYIHIYTDYKP